MDGTTSKLEVPEFPDFKPDIEKLSKSIERLEKKVTDIKQSKLACDELMSFNTSWKLEYERSSCFSAL